MTSIKGCRPPKNSAHAGRRDVGPPLPADPGSVCFARRTVGDLCHAANLAQISDDAQLLGSDSVTNAVVHGRVVVVRAYVGPRELGVEVQDDDPRQARVRHAADDDEGTRGITMLVALAAAWGVQAFPSANRSGSPCLPA